MSTDHPEPSTAVSGSGPAGVKDRFLQIKYGEYGDTVKYGDAV
jgi:hypothetical protein